MNDFKEFFIERSIYVDCEKRLIRDDIWSDFDSFIRGDMGCYEKMCFCDYCKYGGSSLYCNKLDFTPFVFGMMNEDWDDESCPDSFFIVYCEVVKDSLYEVDKALHCCNPMLLCWRKEGDIYNLSTSSFLLYLVNDEFLVNSNDLFLSQSLLGTLSKVGVLRHSDFEEEEEWVFIYFNTFPFLLYCLLYDKL